MRKILILGLLLTIIFIAGCTKIFKKPHDQPVKSACEVCKKVPFYVDGTKIYGSREQR